ncbi:hypothetical protein AXG93_4620s1860 [Marchantia polymorpha subsp. ruderalis]|uniref:Uncharacterized protein n=1 Tax=Marchantia polymorpha subsp. ruderalis TaxID=1480154 RepID=A0A176VYD4_MARPO|nr:hypothetical protein AXG93_4620s1860 [Marchantia polymorpha subsp. ruderalis]
MWNRTQRSGYLYQSGLTERFFLNLASGLRENSHSKLTSLVLHDSWGNAVKFIIEVLTGHHQLETLILDITWGGDEATVRLLSQALKQNSSLKQLALWQVKDGCAALLLNALAGDDGNRSIEQLELKGMSGIGKCLAEVFISNRSLRVVTLDWIFMDVEEWRLLGEAIRDNATATTVSVQFSNFKFTSHVNFLASYTHVNYVLEEFSWAASSEGKEPVLHLELYDSERDSLSYVSRTSQLSKLKFLGSVLRGEIKSVHSLSLPLHGIYLSRGMSIEDILPINRITGETSSLKRLQLHGIYYVMWLWKHLVQCLRWNTSVNSLSLCFSLKKKEFKHGAFKDGGELKEEFEDGEFKDGGGLEEEFEDGEFEEVFRDLMALLQANLTLQEIDVSKTPWARDGKAALIEAALKQNQERAEYMSVFTEAKLQLGDAKAGRLFLCGSPRAVLGELIAMGQHFKAQESNAYEKIMSSDSYTSKDGFVSESVFTRLIETFLEKQPRLQNVDREVIEKILFNLDLGFKLENSFQYFIPSFIMEEQKQQEGVRVVSMSWESKAANPNFVGIRIQCKDQKTMSLSAAFFPRYQMFMRRKLISEMSVPMETMTFSRYYLKLFLDGHEIYVEHVQSEESHYYVDVLMLCSEHKSKETAIKYVLYNIVKELISFCATPNGCPS